MRAFLGAVLLLTASLSHAYPIPPQTLWDLTLQAELIVVAEVGSIGEETEGEWPDSIAVLAVKEAWKGPKAAAIQVHFSPNVICPAPAVYETGKSVVAFLSRYEGEWHTEGLSYGTRYPGDAAELAAHRLAVSEALRLQRDAGDKSAPAAWSLLVARDRSTRWDGLYALAHASDALHARYDGPRVPVQLTPEHLKTLEALFITSPSFDRTLPMFLSILKPTTNPKVTSTAIDAFDTVMKHEVAPWWSNEVMELIEARLGVETRKAPVEDVTSEEIAVMSKVLGSSSEREVQYQSAWEALKRRHRLEPRPSPGYERSISSRTGGNTPP